MSVERQLLGRSGEDLAEKTLRRHGYTIVDRNYRCHCGELDIIAKNGETLVFIEVKTRSNDRYGPPQEAVTPRKQRQIARTAQYYLVERGLGDCPCRFDVVSIVGGGAGPARVEIITGAFDLSP